MSNLGRGRLPYALIVVSLVSSATSLGALILRPEQTGSLRTALNTTAVCCILVASVLTAATRRAR